MGTINTTRPALRSGFTEVFFDGNGRRSHDGGFDAVIGNPPWDMVRGDSGDEAARARNARLTALISTLVTFALAVVLWLNFDSSTADFQFVENVSWFAGAS